MIEAMTKVQRLVASWSSNDQARKSSIFYGDSPIYGGETGRASHTYQMKAVVR
ncbi:hypothetical protein KIN20_011298 [Parelaphostrongylus tenuis]|uniref:Uncharacterized protein n=1 Tax=Parelaphostrongylus tenuis TaxID=148309 RepID=A0AAD5MDW7_PARTN|nr:hypothetical protein KIN20_011298 [Parelaphostrongylus tenuis]